ncbi:hypothetical protein V8G54_033075 [Vigna mungo]|uniref:Retrovirus-related Pol polyprotein from transposon TNT 1-94 n=1 Tax=Vigna mungo TaxID=3915 RepID=A0AAQ3RII5_VIGMU
MAFLSQNPTQTPDHLMNPANPLYLHPGENLALVLVTPLLTENNFHQWERDMVVALETKNKERFIDDTLSCPPPTDPLHEAWRRSNRMVVLAHLVDDSFDQAIYIWRDLKDRFSHADKFRISDLQDQILACRQGDLSVSEYYTKLKILWKELELYRCVLTYTCSTQCACGLLSKLHKEQEDDYVIRFLRGLNESYAQVHSQIMILDPMPSIVKTINSSASKHNSKNTKFCEKCKKANHTIETCYFRIGFPAGYRKNKPHNKASASLVEIDSTAPIQHLDLDGNPPNDQFTFSKDQYQAILALLQHTKDHSSSVNHASVHNSGTSAFVPWILDSGATYHICPTKSFFHSLHPIKPINIKFPNHTTIIAHFSGNIDIGDLLLTNALFVPDFSVHLIFVPKLVSTIDCMAVFCDSHCFLFQMSHFKMIGAARKINGLPDNLAAAVGNREGVTIDAGGHRSCGTRSFRSGIGRRKKLGIRRSSQMNDKDVDRDQPSAAAKKAQALQTLAAGAQKTRKGHTYATTYKEGCSLGYDVLCLKILHDFHVTFGKLPLQQIMIILAYRTELVITLWNFIKCHENQKWSSLTSNDAPGWLRRRLDRKKQHSDINVLQCFVFGPRKGGKSALLNSFIGRPYSEGYNPTNEDCYVVNVVDVSMVFPRGMDKVTLILYAASRTENQDSVYFNLVDKRTTITFIDSNAFANTITSGRTKLDKRASKCIFLGFKSGVKGYLLYDLLTNSFLISRNVIFYESHFPYWSPANAVSHNHNTGTAASQQSFDSLIAFDTPDSHFNICHDSHIASDHVSTNNDSIVVEPIMQFNDDCNDFVQHVDQPARISTRLRKPPAYLSDYDCSPLSFANISSCTRYPLQSYLSYSNCSNSHTVFYMSLSAIIEPTSFKEACQHYHWQQAMLAEIQALEKNQTWSLVRLPPKKNVVGCKWVYKTKLNAAGSIERYKARLVAKGFTQTEGMDFFETFSPVVKITTVRFLLSIVVSRKWFLHQLDVDNAFLHGDLDEEVYMKPPPGLILPEPNLVCKLHKSLYGLRQASRQWNSKLTSALLSCGFSQSTADHSLFIRKTATSFIALLVYVDDIVLTGDNMDDITTVKQFLNQKFRIKDLGNLKYFLGFEVARSQQGLILNQRKYCLDILADFGLTGCKPTHSPSNPNDKLKDDDGDILPDPTSYRRLIGKLQYLTNIRPDISFVVQQVSQFMSKPRSSHLNVVFRILKYLKGCPGLGLFYPSTNPHRLQAFSDSYWATCSLSRKFITGYCVFYGNSLISWKSKKQSTVSRSSTEVEYRALASVACELQWLKYIVDDLCLKIPLPFSTFCDNQSAVQLAKNPSFYERTKHIEVDCHFIRAKVLDGLIVLSHVPSKHQLADMFTKSLYPGSFNINLSKMGLLNIHHPS